MDGNSTVTSTALPSDCSLVRYENGTTIAFFNEAASSEAACGGGEVWLRLFYLLRHNSALHPIDSYSSFLLLSGFHPKPPQMFTGSYEATPALTKTLVSPIE